MANNFNRIHTRITVASFLTARYVVPVSFLTAKYFVLPCPSSPLGMLSYISYLTARYAVSVPMSFLTARYVVPHVLPHRQLCYTKSFPAPIFLENGIKMGFKQHFSPGKDSPTRPSSPRRMPWGRRKGR